LLALSTESVPFWHNTYFHPLSEGAVPHSQSQLEFRN
jgi:hypothetical protein